MNLDLYNIMSKALSLEAGENKLRADASKDLLYKSMYLLEALIAENSNSNNMNSIKMLYEDIKDFLVNNKD